MNKITIVNIILLKNKTRKGKIIERFGDKRIKIIRFFKKLLRLFIYDEYRYNSNKNIDKFIISNRYKLKLCSVYKWAHDK